MRSRRESRHGVVPGLLSIVVPVYNVEDYLDPCLLSLRQQRYRKIEIVVVDDGSPDRSVEVARRHRRRDPRVRIIRRVNGGLSAARNTGVAAARGEFLAFVDSDDTVEPLGYRRALRTLGRTGSDFAVMCYQRIKKSRIVPASEWIRDVHRGDRLGVTLSRAPDVMRNSMACSKIFRTEFWRRTGLGFVEGIHYEDQQLTAEAYARASSFDILRGTLYNWRQRQDNTSITASRNDPERAAANLEAQLDSAFATYGVLAEHATVLVAQERVLQIVRNDLAQFLQRLPFSGDDFWGVLTSRVPRLLDLVPREDYDRQVPSRQKQLHQLVRTGDRAQAVELIASGDTEFDSVFVADGNLFARLRGRDAASVETLRLADSETQLHSGVRRVLEPEPGILELEGWALVSNLSLHAGGHSVCAIARAEGRDPVELRASTFTADWIDEIKVPGDPSCDRRNGGLRVWMDMRTLGAGSWTVEVTLDVDGITRTGLVHHRDPRSTRLLPAPVAAGSGRIGTVWVHWNRPLVVEVHEPEAVLRGLRLVAPDQAELSLEGPRAREVFLRRPISQVPMRPLEITEADGVTTARFTLPGGSSSRRWTVLLPGRGDEIERVGLSPQRAGERVPHDSTTVVLDRLGACVVRVEDRVAYAHSISLTDEGLEALISVTGREAGRLTPRLGSPAHCVEGTASRVPDGLKVCVPWVSPGYDGVPRPLPADWYGLELVDSDSDDDSDDDVVVVLADEHLTSALPDDALVGQVRAVATTRLHDQRAVLGVRILPPLAVQERGDRNQARLQALANAGTGASHSVIFRTLFGEATNDSARELHRELRRRGSRRQLLWSVRDHSVPIPEGGVGLIEGTEAWHRALGDAGCVVVNMHQPAWFRRPERQLMVQTFHGYPYKRMGYSHWVGTGLSAQSIASYFDRARDWTHLVSPSSYATPLLLREFFDPQEEPSVQVIETGYPRNDPLLAAGLESVRSRVRAQLGVPEDAKVVLYAPTFRDALSVDGKSARRGDFLRPDEFVTRAGEGCYLLLRGHAFHMRDVSDTASTDRVVDVTYHPDVTDLVIASDAAILDYSSLRFDYALTRKPMVFLVPDEPEYHALRPGLLPYDETAPGPRVADTAAAAASLADLDRLRSQYGPAIERFIATYLELDDGHAAARVVDELFAADAAAADALAQAPRLER
ncbi:MAG: CDP-glycerol glycerophosphotransferase family protein [Marmoricola sp.]